MIKFEHLQGDKYIIIDCIDEEWIGSIVRISWLENIMLDCYYDIDEKGVIYDIATGSPVGYLEVVEDAN